jgi:geranyl-CoA carboxylase alpha subunit
VTRFSKILIANRGEIACRVMRSARALGYRTVAVYSEADRHMPHMALADQAVPIGPAPAAHSYLAIDKIIAAARRAGADAIHPGYGFLSENAAFADACAAADIAFIGPPVDAIRLMGNKAAAKRRMIPAGVPCVPGYDGEAQNDAVLMREAELIGFPIMVKATAGGGGKGMRLVAAMPQLAEALRAARSEALKAFGSDELILEKAILESRHVEIQVFGDTHGNVIHLFERDCSVQRRHQKVIEEAPSPVMTPALRYAMGAAAVAAAKTIGYVGAGTVEFLLAPDGKFYFLEMNTRLQVEHPVTEMVTGLDLVEWQLRVAAGDRLPLGQEQVAFRGHAIEVRLYAEDAHGDFLPQAGTLLAWEPPQGAGVRVDHGVASGVAISPYYDPMIAKIIAHGATREEARRRLVVALQDTLALGIETNRRFLIDCLSHPAFAAGETSTAFIERHFPPAERAPPAPPPRMLTLAAALMAEQGREAEAGSLSHWHSSGRAIAPLMLQSGEAEIALRVTAEGERRYHVEGGTPHPNPPRPGGREILHRADRPSPLDEEGWLGGSSGVDIELLHTDGTTVRFLCNGLAETGRFCWQDDTLHLSLDGATAVFEDVALARRGAGADAAAGAALAPMTGIISAVRVRAGDAVRKGQCLVILEAMKMEHEILAPRDGTVAAVLVAPGEQVMTRRLLVELVPAA